jgi:nicotinamidase-related amidase
MPDLPIDSSSSALVLFDMLNGFVNSSNALRTEVARGAIGPCREMLEGARAASMRVFYANSTHRPDATDYGATLVDANTELEPWPDGPQLMGKPPGTEGTSGAEVIPELAPAPEDYIVLKHRWSAFAGTSMDILLRSLGIDTIVLAGGSTDIGILSTACAARDLGYNLVILRNACHTHRADAQEFLMTRIFPRMSRLMTVAQAVELLG